MAALLKYQMQCESDDCGKMSIILVDPEEDNIPNICPFCGGESFETTEDIIKK